MRWFCILWLIARPSNFLMAENLKGLRSEFALSNSHTNWGWMSYSFWSTRNLHPKIGKTCYKAKGLIASRDSIDACERQAKSQGGAKKRNTLLRKAQRKLKFQHQFPRNQRVNQISKRGGSQRGVNKKISVPPTMMHL